MTDHRPRLGILFFTSGWFRDVGIQSSSSGVTEEENRVAADIVERVARFAEPVFDGVLFSEAEAERAAGRIVWREPTGSSSLPSCGARTRS